MAMKKLKEPDKASDTTGNHSVLSPEDARAFDERFEALSEEVRNEEYLQSLRDERTKLENEQGRQTDPQRYNDLLMLLVNAGTIGEPSPTPFRAIQAILSAGYVGFPMPPWALKMFDETIYARLKGDIKSLDSALGFSGIGRQGKTTPPMQQQLIRQRNDKLCSDVYRWTMLEKDVESACQKVIQRLMATPNWNNTAYDLDLIKRKAKKKDLYTRKIEMEESLKRLYYQWKKDCNDERVLKRIREKLEQNPELFKALFP